MTCLVKKLPHYYTLKTMGAIFFKICLKRVLIDCIFNALIYFILLSIHYIQVF